MSAHEDTDRGERAALFRSERYVRIAVEAGTAPLLWDREEGAWTSADLPVSADLRARFVNWWGWFVYTTLYSRNRDYLGPRIDGAEYAAEGRAIAEAVKRELPDWTVVYDDPQLGQRIEIG